MILFFKNVRVSPQKKLYFCTILLTIYKSCGSKCDLQTLAFTNFYWHHGTDNWKQKLNFCFFNFLNLTIFDLLLKRAWKISCRVIQKGSHSQNDNSWPILPHVTHCCFFSETFYFMPSTEKWQNMKWKRRIFLHKWLLVKHVMLYQKTKKRWEIAVFGTIDIAIFTLRSTSTFKMAM